MTMLLIRWCDNSLQRNKDDRYLSILKMAVHYSVSLCNEKGKLLITQFWGKHENYIDEQTQFSQYSEARVEELVHNW